jgi:hypothetical protein
MGDELRFSGRLGNHSGTPITDIEIIAFGKSVSINNQTLKPGERLNFLDIRHVVSEQEVESGVVNGVFSWRARKGSQEIISGEKKIKLSTVTGLPII